ncbi:MAG: ribosome biogenesis GTPase Der [Candidatus Cloacimonetes bacterium]|nr:ribosome biogenesis GTPase Der [Candidatus Cloacimonadota bacterium]
MRKSIVAIVGRPNVGKSTLFNRICKKRSAIVDFEEGITRDRKYQDAEWSGIYFTLVDTGGIIPRSEDTMNQAIRYQAEAAISEADVILFMVDAKTGATDFDIEISHLLSPVRDRVLLVVNKVDSEKDMFEIYDFLQLGLGEAFPVAAVHGRNCGNLLDELIKLVNPVRDGDLSYDRDKIKIAIVGRPNVGKSSLVNKIYGKDINIVTDIPGTTRDSIDSKVKYFGEEITIVDTAGLRKKVKVKYGAEYFSSMRTIEAIHQSNMVILMLDAEKEIATQDQKIASFAQRHHRDILILVNKWDLVKKDNKSTGEFIQKIKDELPFISYAPVMFISALTGQRVSNVLRKVVEVKAASKRRIPTSELNKFLADIVATFPPSHSSGLHSKIYYCTQTETNPPTFVFFCNNPKLITKHYNRFIINRLRERFPLEGVSFRVHIRGRKGEEEPQKL